MLCLARIAPAALGALKVRRWTAAASNKQLMKVGDDRPSLAGGELRSEEGRKL